jgi:diguanylate cyclase (GGDEF)-like protein
MPLDVKTLYLLNIVVATVAASVCFFSWSRHRDSAGLLGWGAGLALGAAGSLLVSLRPPGSAIGLAIAGNTMIVCGYATVWAGVRQFNHRPFEIHLVAAALVLFGASFTLVTLGGAHVASRVLMVSLAIAALSFLVAWEVDRNRAREPIAGRLPTTIAFAVIGLAMLIRAGFALLSGPAPADTPYYDATQGSMLFVNTICVVAATLGLLMMANERLRRRYEAMAGTDELTGLPNRRFFMDQGGRLANRAAHEGTPNCVLMIDLDHFSDVNRRFGHAGGDRALIAFAHFARENLRPADLLARYGGEEFCVVLVATSEQEAMLIAERLRAGIADLRVDIAGQAIAFTISAGVARLAGSDLSGAIRRADIALYRAKALGRNRVSGAVDAEPRSSVQQRDQAAGALR